MIFRGWSAHAAASIDEIASNCDLIFTCTPSREPLLGARHVASRPADAPGLHICALGSDQEGKQELEEAEDYDLEAPPPEGFEWGVTY